ncbi:hypothetical protein BD289DRAFT_425212 [Coniella lustricola]|uniref:Uncharacterized protein n=1 Tax=Coniella lustricola TaxID=2025994 RepID=A0A2T3AHN7_9PEZI|nr:hypothetical protein BD289DRAFT_425212 [Coniella lustricola]
MKQKALGYRQEIRDLENKLGQDSKLVAGHNLCIQDNGLDLARFITDLNAIFAPLQDNLPASDPKSKPAVPATNIRKAPAAKGNTPQRTDIGNVHNPRKTPDEEEWRHRVHGCLERVQRITSIMFTAAREAEKRLLSKEVQLAEFRVQHDQSERDMIRLQQKVTELESRTTTLDALQTDLASTTQRWHDANSMGQRVKEANKQLQQNIIQLQNQLSDVETRSGMVEAQRDSITLDLERATEENVRLQEMVSTTQENHKSLEKLFKDVAKEKNTLEAAGLKTVDETKQLRQQVDALEKDRAVYRGCLSTATTQRENLNAKCTTMLLEKDDSQGTLAGIKTQLAASCKQLQETEIAKAALECGIRTAADKEKKLLDTNVSLKGKIATLEGTVKAGEMKWDEVHTKGNEVAQQKAQLQKEFDRISRELKSSREKLRAAEAKRDFSSPETRVRTEQNKQLQRQLDEAQHAHDATLKQLKAAEGKLEAVKAESDVQTKTEQETVSKLQMQLTEAQQALVTSKELLKDTEEQKQVLRTESQNNARQRGQLQAEIHKIGVELDDAKSALSKFDARLRNSEAKNEVLKDEIRQGYVAGMYAVFAIEGGSPLLRDE